jgi:hypothetical protein
MDNDIDTMHRQLARLEAFYPDSGHGVGSEKAKEAHRELELGLRLGARAASSITDRQIQRMVVQFNRYWKIITGKDIHFKFDKGDVSTLSSSEPSLIRDYFMSKHFTQRPFIIDVFGGVGGDVITFLFMLAPEKIHCIEFVRDQHDREKYDKLLSNIQNFKAAMPDYIKNIDVQTFQSSCQTYFTQTPPPRIDLLYLDPPWVLNGANRECTAAELIDYLIEEVFSHVFGPAAQAITNVTPHVICIKTRFGWPELESIMNKIPEFYRMDSTSNTPFRGTYYFHTLVVKNPELHTWVHSDVWNMVYDRKWQKGKAKAETQHIQFIEPVKPEVYSRKAQSIIKVHTTSARRF